jgi:hypothetical protein
MAGKNRPANKRTTKAKNEKSGNNFADLGHELMTLVDHAKEKYNGLDENKKKALIAGAVGAIALIAGAIGHRRRAKR